MILAKKRRAITFSISLKLEIFVTLLNLAKRELPTFYNLEFITSFLGLLTKRNQKNRLTLKLRASRF